MSTDQTLRIAIVGAGIGGLVLSAALDFMDRESKFEIKIYESSKQLAEIGAGINFWSRTWDAFKGIGLDDKLEEILVESPPDPQSIRTAFQIRKSDQHDGVYVQDLKMKGGYTRFRRADLQKVLSSDMRGELHMSHRLLFYEELNNEVVLHFQDGKTASCDLLIGADGIRSAVRRCFLSKQDPSRPLSLDPIFWSGEYAFRGLVEVERLQAEFPEHRACNEPVIYIGKYKFVVAYRVPLANMISVGVFILEPSKEVLFGGPESASCGQEEVLASFQGWEPEALALLSKSKHQICATDWEARLTPFHLVSPTADKVGDTNHEAAEVLCEEKCHSCRLILYHHTRARVLVWPSRIPTSWQICSQVNTAQSQRSRKSPKSMIYFRCGPANDVLERARISGRLFSLTGPGFEDVAEGDTSVSLSRLTELMDDMGLDLEG